MTHDFFISFAGEDRDTVARPLAEALEKQGFSVWFDEHELAVGDSLSEKEDDGLGQSRFGVVVISSSFFAKEWPKRELAGLVAPETTSATKVILPLWHEIDLAEVSAVSPPLADRMAANTANGIEEAAASIVRSSGLQPGFRATIDRIADEVFDAHGFVVAPATFRPSTTKSSQSVLTTDWSTALCST